MGGGGRRIGETPLDARVIGGERGRLLKGDREAGHVMPPPTGMDDEARHKLASLISAELCEVGLPTRPPSPHLPSSQWGNGAGGVSHLLETP